jgi:hypothetical protein
MIELASRKLRNIGVLLIWISSVVASSTVAAAAELTAADRIPDRIKAVTADDYRLVVLSEGVGSALARPRSIGKVVDSRGMRYTRKFE